MLKNYLKIAFRNLFKNKLNSTINIFGLSVGIAASLIIFLFAHNELTYDAFHKNAESIYLVYKERITPTGTQITLDTWIPMAHALKSEYTGIKNATRLWDTGEWVQVADKKFEENVTYADPSLFEIFTFPLLKGEPATIFSDLHSVVISKEIAQKYFGEENPIGKTITISYDTDYTVRGVLADIPRNSTTQIDILAPFESLSFYDENKDNWGGSFLFTFIQLNEGLTAASLEEQFPNFVTKIWDAELNKSMNLKMLPLLDLYNELTEANIYAYILLGVALVILIIASINFMNLTTARSLERAREIGMRKVLGAARRQLIKQFLSESLLMAGLALLLGICLLEVFLPRFNSLYEMSLQMNYFENALTILALISLAVVVGFLSGAYPAFVLSRFQPADSLKGQLKFKPGGKRLRHSLVITQFSLAIVLIIGTGIMWKQIQFMKNANLNFDKENVLAIPVSQSDFEDEEQAQVRLETFKAQLREHTGILSVASSTHIPGRWPGWFTFAYPTDRDDSQRLRVRRCFVDAHYFDTYGIEFVQGRNFSEQLSTDAEESMIVNEAALRDIGWPSAQGRQVRVGETVYNVVGVVKDYNFDSLVSEVAPVLHFYRPPDSGTHRVVSAKLAAGNITGSLDFIRNQWQKLDPTRPLDFFFVDDNFARLYENELRLGTVTTAFTVLSIIIACLGLFALASLMVTQRTKEIGVRKTLGASVKNIVVLVSKAFAGLVAIAFVFACPVAYFLANWWLQDFAYRTALSWDMFILAGLLALLTAVITVSYHSIKAALTNPVEALRYE